MNPLYAQLALDWLEAERAHNPDEWKDRIFDRSAMSVAVDRVYQVVAGEVKWSEASPGDKAVWKSRVEDVPMFLRTWRKNGKAVPVATDEAFTELMKLARMPDGGAYQDAMNQTTPRPPGQNGPHLQGYRERTWWSFYDTWENVGVADSRGREQRTAILFNHMNVGQPFLTNLQVGHQFPNDETFVVLGVYAAVSTLDALSWGANRIRVDFLVGNRQCLPELLLRDLFRGIDLVGPTRRPLVIPVRQTFSARVTLKDVPPADLPSFDFTFHMEGLRTRDIG